MRCARPDSCAVHNPTVGWWVVKWSVSVTPPASWRNCCRCCYWEKLQIISSAADFQLWLSSVAGVVRRGLGYCALLPSWPVLGGGRGVRGPPGVKWSRGAQHLQSRPELGRGAGGAGGATETFIILLSSPPSLVRLPRSPPCYLVLCYS